MADRQRRVNALLIAVALAIIGVITVFYVNQLNKAISENIISSISEIAEHDKATIQTYIDICWNDLYEIQDRFIGYGCETIEDIEVRMNLECASSDFTHIYILTEDGTIYTDKFVTYSPGNDVLRYSLDFLPYFEDGRERVILRFDDEATGGWMTKESILYGVRLHDYEVDGVKMLALIGISDISSIQDHMVIHSFMKDGNSRGTSFLIDMGGNYIVDVNRGVYLNRRANLYNRLTNATDSGLTIEEVAQKLNNRETFSFYHTHIEDGTRDLLYFIPLAEDMDLYFLMAVMDDVFKEQTSAFTTMSMTMLAVSMITIIGMLLIIMRNQYKAIQATEKARSQKEFLSNMSHEIRTPLNGLIGLNHLMMEYIDDESQKPQIKEWLEKSKSTANYLLSLVNDILDLSKLQAGKVSLVNEPLLLTRLIDEVASMQADNIQNRGVEFIVETDITEPCIEGDATRIKQVLMNIVGNAAKFTPEGKSIRFSVSQEKTDGTHVTTLFRCEDTGIGISAEYIDKIFDSFSQERSRNTNSIKGTGLGMTISKILVNAMGGDITVESELDVGSTFYVDEIKAIPESFDTKDATDILFEGYFNMASYVHTGRVVPLDDIISDGLRKDIDDASWAMSMVNGKTYMLPFYSMQNIMIYNKGLFESCGLEKYSSDEGKIQNWTMEEWAEILDTLAGKLPDRTYPMMMYGKNNQGDTHIMTFMRSCGGTIFDEAGNFDFESEKTIQALEWIQGGVSKGWYPPKPENLEIENCNELFYNGQLAIYMFNNSNFSFFDNMDDFGFVNFPGNLATSFATGFEVFDNGDEAKIKASKDFIRFIYENEEWLDVSAGNIPACKSVAEKYKDQITMLDEFVSNSEHVVDFMNNSPNWQGNDTSVRSVFWPNIHKLLSGAVTPRECAQALNEDCNAALQTGREDSRLHE